MRLVDIMNSAWAITPDMLNEIQRIYTTRMMGPKLDRDEIVAAIEAKTGEPFRPRTYGSRVENGVAVLNLEGILARRMNMMMSISTGGTSMEMVQRDLQAALDDPAVKGVILDIDSPGGTVSGTEELGETIYRARGKKPIVAYSGSQICSAAYWVAAACDAIYVVGDTPLIGSIGVVCSHVDVSKREEQMGIKTTEITAGKYKRIASAYEPLTEEGRAAMQAQADSAYTAFVNAVAKYRGTTPEDVLGRMADGRMFRGKEAITAGLVDGVSSMDELMRNMSKGTMPMSKKKKPMMAAPAGVAAEAETEETMDLATLKEKHLETYEAAFAEGAASKTADEAAIAAAREQGAAAERERIQGVEAVLIPGHEALITQLKFDGKTTAGEAALQIVGAERQLQTGALSAITKGANEAVPSVEPADNSAAEVAADAPLDERAKAEWDKDKALAKEFGSYDSYLAFRRAEESGRARILKK